MFIIPKRTATIATTATVVSSRMPCSTLGRCFDGFLLNKATGRILVRTDDLPLKKQHFWAAKAEFLRNRSFVLSLMSDHLKNT